MTNLQKFITSEVKAHNKERELEQFNKGLKFLSMEMYNKEGYENFVLCSSGHTMARYEVKFTFTAKKYENNVVKYMVNIYSDGSMGIYFDGTEYRG